jgi:ABC-type lipoprotein export system ATPase subunit
MSNSGVVSTPLSTHDSATWDVARGMPKTSAPANTIQRVEAYGIHDRYNVAVDLYPDINILYGRNGSGKTTLLHIIANILNGSLERFAFLQFDRIILTRAGQRRILLERGVDKERAERIAVILGRTRIGSFTIDQAERYAQATEPDEEDHSLFQSIKQKLRPISRPAYFPAFRTMIEAWASVEPEVLSRRYPRRPSVPLPERDLQPTALARTLFGPFVPDIRYPSPQEIERELSAEARSAALRIAETGQRGLSRAFVDVLEAVLSGAILRDEKTTSADMLGVFAQIVELQRTIEKTRIIEGGPRQVRPGSVQEVRNQLAHQRTRDLERTAAYVLDVYRKSLEDQASLQGKLSAPISQYLASVNEFLEGKHLVVTRKEVASSSLADRHDRLVWIKFEDGSLESLRSLSSGERQIVSMLYAARHMAAPHDQAGSAVLIDEPEISLHVDWQRPLMSKMCQQLGKRQIIVCTHSPQIGGDYEDNFQELSPIPVKAPPSKRISKRIGITR